MSRLSDVIHGRDNNFHILRLLAASAVLYSHSFPLATGSSHDEPLRAASGCTFGSIAVDLFFAISGMLVTMSLVRRQSAVDFARARFFRIWPGLGTAVLLAVFVLGPLLTTLPLTGYFASKGTVRYLAYNLFLFKDVVYTLPGVFAANPWPEAVNGSLWTLPSEVRCYVLLLASWMLLRRVHREARMDLAVAVVWAALMAWFVYTLRSGTVEDSPARLWLMFCSGSLLYLWRDRIRLWATAAAVAAAAVLLCAGHGLGFGVVYAVALPYLMLCAAYLPRGAILQYNRLGDYSFGVYIYAYPVQQLLMHAWPTLGPLGLFSAALPLTLVLAVLSWHMIEKPAMALARPRNAVLVGTGAKAPAA